MTSPDAPKKNAKAENALAGHGGGTNKNDIFEEI